MKRLFVFLLVPCFIGLFPLCNSKETLSWLDRIKGLNFLGKKEVLPDYQVENGTNADLRGAIDLTIGSNTLTTKIQSGIDTFAAYTSISANIVTIGTVIIFAFPLIVLLFYLSLIVLFPDPGSPVKFERDVAVTVKHLKYVAADIEDRVFDFLEEITDPYKYNPPTNSYPATSYSPTNHGSDPYQPHSSSYTNINPSGPPQTQTDYHHFHGPHADTVDSYVQYSSNQNKYQPLPQNNYQPLPQNNYYQPVPQINYGQNHLYGNNNMNLAQNNMQRPVLYSQSPISKNLVVQRPFNNLQHSSNILTAHPQSLYGSNGFAPKKDPPNLATFDNGQANYNSKHLIEGGIPYQPLINSAFDPMYNVGPLTTFNAQTKNPLIDQRGETFQSIETKLKAFDQMNSKPLNKRFKEVLPFPTYENPSKFSPPAFDYSLIIPKNALMKG